MSTRKSEMNQSITLEMHSYSISSRKVSLFTWNLISPPTGVFESVSFHMDIWTKDI